MRNHLYRSLVILFVMIVAAVNIVPTAGWYTLGQTERDTRLAQWKQEDFDRAGQDVSFVQRYAWSIQRWTQFNRDWVINMGLDLQGGVHMVVGFYLDEEAEEKGFTQEELQEIALQTIQNRIAEFEAQEPIIQALGDSQVQIQLPGEKDVQRARDLIMKTGVLGFHIGALGDETNQILIGIDKHFDNGFIPFLNTSFDSPYYSVPREHFERLKGLVDEAEKVPGLIPEGRMIAFSPAPPDFEKDANYTLYVIDSEPSVGGGGIKNAVARPNPESPGQWTILFEFDSEAGQQFGELTGNNVNKPLAIVLDGNVMSAPNINSRITTSGSIDGNFGSDDAQNLAITLESGAMPVDATEDYTGIVGATIGGESASKGVTASIIGLALVVIFMVGYYRAAGLMADIALMINALLILGAFAYFNTTLTLPGIAGLILTIGMAVDANVLIFERIREELKLGKSLPVAIEGGYARASSAIVDANATTLIAAVVLTQFGTGPVQGFAIALCIGICTSVFAALVVTRAMLEFVAERKILTNLSMASILKSEPKYSFMPKRKQAAMVSVVVILVGLAYFGYRGQGNFGVDFTTGTNMQVSIKSTSVVGVDPVRELLTDAGYGSAIVQESSEAGVDDPNRFLIRVSEGANVEGSEETTATVSDGLQTALASLSDVASENLNDKVEILRSETVGPAIGEKLRNDAVFAIFFSLIFIILYLWMRFEWKYAVGAVVALMHDVLIVIGVLSICQRDISIPVVAALLTIIGYSLNDTIVVFDRVREDIALNKSRGMNFLDMLNTSINRTLSRTLLTSMTTLVVVIVLYVFGGPAINDFALALIAGVIVGTYSSVFVATPVVYALQQIVDKREAAHLLDGKKKKPKPA